MKRSWTAMAVALTAIFAAMGCNDYGNTFQVPTGASISTLSPSNISAGSPQFTLTVTGGGFVAKTVVQWNGQTIATQVQTDANNNVGGSLQRFRPRWWPNREPPSSTPCNRILAREPMDSPIRWRSSSILREIRSQRCRACHRSVR